MSGKFVFRVPSLLNLVVFGALLARAGEPPAVAGDSDNKAAESFWSGHFEVIKLEQIIRFNYMDSESGAILSRDVQYRLRGMARVKFTGSGSSYLQFRAENGQGFDNSWTNTGLGRGPGAANFFVKSLFLGQRIGSHLELQAGGIEFEQGAGSQHTYASGDGYMTGYRALVSGVEPRFGFDKFVATVGYVGDFANANVFPRLQNDLGQVNYLQVLAERNFGERARVSTEMDSIRGIWFTRQALQWQRPLPSVLDEVLFEAITRTSDQATFGASVTISRSLDVDKRWHALAIYSQLPAHLFEDDKQQPILFPQGEIDRGKRLSLGANYDVTRRFFVGAFAGRLLDDTTAKRYVAQIAVGYDYTGIINRLLHPASRQ